MSTKLHWVSPLRRLAGLALSLGLSAATLTLAPSTASASENLIKRPGAHNRYSVELEPHLSLYYGDWSNRVEGGPGVRVAIPFMHNGPIDTINNNIGISFGADTYFPGGAFVMRIPVAFQWNFYFTDIISVLGEVGLSTSFGDLPDLWFDPIMSGGGRFQFGKVGVVVRVGYPEMTVGANFQF
jgi:hypothetical protein